MSKRSLDRINPSSTIHLHLYSPVSEGEDHSLLPTDEGLEDCVRSQLETARFVQVDWSDCLLRDRLNILTNLRLKIASDPQALATTVNRHNQAETLAAEVLPLLDACRFLETEAPRILREQKVSKHGRPKWLWGNQVVLRPEPLGVVLIIGPANYPLMLPGIQALQAVTAGNAVLIKPAASCSQPLKTLLSLAESAGLPEGLIQVLPESAEAATLAIRHGVDKAFVTGSATTGKAVSRELAESTTPSVMELSGCDAVFVLEDADLNLVSDCLLFGLTLNNSQTCMAPRRVFAHDQQADELLRLLKAKIEASNHDQNIIQLAQSSDIVEQSIRAAVASGAELVCGSLSDSTSSKFSGVAVLDHVTADMSLAQSDIFAPLLSFIRVDSEMQALEQNAQCPFALSATVFGSSKRCHQFARRINAGCVVINDLIVPTADPRVPFGGRGMSGHGVTRGQAGLLEMTQLKAIVATRGWFRPHLHQPTAADVDVLEQLIRIEHSANPLQSLRAVPKMITATIKQMKLRRAFRNNEESATDHRSTGCAVESNDSNSLERKKSHEGVQI